MPVAKEDEYGACNLALSSILSVMILIRVNMKPTVTPRLSALVARDARRVVVFRRGPSKHVRMLLWNLEDDSITPGQWFKGRIYTERCSLSPNGELLLYFGAKYKGEVPALTALSRPPYFTALAFWPQLGTWGGGGYFRSNHDLVLGAISPAAKDTSNEVHIPKALQVRHYSDLSESEKQVEAYWQLVQAGQEQHSKRAIRSIQENQKQSFEEPMDSVFDPPMICRRQNPHESELYLEQRTLGFPKEKPYSPVETYRLVHLGSGKPKPLLPPERCDLGVLDWAAWAPSGSLIYAKEGCLYRDRCIGPKRLTNTPELIANLCDQEMSPISPPPEALQWPAYLGRSRRQKKH